MGAIFSTAQLRLRDRVLICLESLSSFVVVFLCGYWFSRITCIRLHAESFSYREKIKIKNNLTEIINLSQFQRVSALASLTRL